MLLDGAMLRGADAQHIAKLVARGEPGVEPVEPLYTEQDVVHILNQMIGLPHRQKLCVTMWS